MKTTIHLTGIYMLKREILALLLFLAIQGLLQSTKAMGENPLAGTGLSVVDTWFINELLVIEYP